MINKKYLCELNNRFDFCDNNYLYYFNDNIINNEILISNSNFVSNINDALDLLNIFLDKGLIKQIDGNNNEHKNDNNIFYIFDINEIENQLFSIIFLISITQSCKLFSIEIEYKTHKKHFKKYKNCFIGSEACEILINGGFCPNIYESIIIGNKWLNNNYISQINGHNNNNNTFENNNNSFYIFNDIEINKQCIIELYNNYNNNSNNTSINITPHLSIQKQPLT